MLKHAEAAHGIRHVALRYFNAAGADPEGELGEMHDPETHLVPLILFAAMGRHLQSRSLEQITQRPMEVAFVITSTLPTWQMRMSPL
jgi:hypothetical protein